MFSVARSARLSALHMVALRHPRTPAALLLSPGRAGLTSIHHHLTSAPWAREVLTEPLKLDS